MNQEKNFESWEKCRVGVEVGGTFTDLVWQDAEGQLHTGKTPSTPQAIHEAVLRVLSDANVSLAQTSQFTHGSTVATNALLTRRGARTGLITTSGFRDVLIIGRSDRDHDVYNVRFRHSKPPIRRSMVREVPERISANGAVLIPIDLEETWRQVVGFLDQGVTAIAISLIHAYRNPVHEQAIKRLINERAPHVVVSASHEISCEFREYERTVTTVINAFVGPVVAQYVEQLEVRLAAGDYRVVLQIMQSNGGAMPAAVARTSAVRMLLSGPAAGVCAAMWFAQRNNIKDAITLDMGGTSTDVAIAPSLSPKMVPQLSIDGLPVRTAAVDMETIGAGGGSIAFIDNGGFLSVGPESAGAMPGPACYGRSGDRPTVTDAQLIAGLLRPRRFFSGKMILHEDQAYAALETLAQTGGVSSVADAVLRIVNSNMAIAVRLVSTRRGIDPRDFTLVAYGGNGPIHAAMVADELGITRVLVPWAPGLASAFGLLIADTMIDVAYSDIHPLSDRSFDLEQVEKLQVRAEESALRTGLPADGYTLALGVDMRYAGQAFELTIWTDGRVTTASALRHRFDTEHRQHYGYARDNLSIEVVSYRIRIVRKNRAVPATPLPTGAGPAPEVVIITIEGNKYTAALLARETLLVGARVSGPAIVEEPTSTTFVPLNWGAEVLPSGDLLLRRAR